MPVIILGGNPTEPGGFSPTVWYKADSETIYVDNDTLTIVTNRGSAGSAVDLTGFTSAPKYKTNIFNGYPAYFADGNDDCFRTNIGSGTVFAAGAGTALCVLKVATANNGFPWILSETGVAAKAHHQANAGQTITAFNNDGAGDTTATKTLTTGTAYCATWLHDSGNLYLGMNDTRTASMASVASGNTTVAAGDDMFLLGSGGANFFNGYVAELICFSTALTEGQRQQWERWFAFKYNLTIAY